MNKTVELVNEWADFETKYPKGSIEDFCRHFLARQRSKTVSGKFVGGVIPPFNDGLLLKIFGRITKLNMFYANKALEGTEINQIEEFGVLATISQDINPRKTDVIYSNLLDLSSGSDMLNRLKERGLIREYRDDKDKRSRRVELTAKGKRVMELCYEKISRNVKMLMYDLDHDDKELCVHMLKEIEIKFSALWMGHKELSFDEIYREVVKVK
jgi:DNA-binding MarR family transcriptional regulator